METENRVRLADALVSIADPRQAGKVKHDLVEMLAVAMMGVRVGAETFVGIGRGAKAKLDWLRRTLRLGHCLA